MGKGTGIENEIMDMINIMKGMVEAIGMEDGAQIGRTSDRVMEEKAVRIDIENMIGADLVLPPDMVAGGLQGVQVVIRGLCRNISGL